MADLSPSPLEWTPLNSELAIAGVSLLFVLACCWAEEYNTWHANLQKNGWYTQWWLHPYFYVLWIFAFEFFSAFAIWIVEREGLRNIPALGLPAPLGGASPDPWKFLAVQTIFLLNAFLAAMIGILHCRWGWWGLNFVNHVAILTLSILAAIWAWDWTELAGGLWTGAAAAAFCMLVHAVYFAWNRNEMAAPGLDIGHWRTLIVSKEGMEIPGNYYNITGAQRVIPTQSSAPTTFNVFSSHAAAPGTTSALSYRHTAAPPPQNNIMMTSVNTGRGGYVPLQQ